MSVNQDISKVSQQRDCPGFAPDSLLIRIHEYEPGTNSAAKIEINSNAVGEF